MLNMKHTWKAVMTLGLALLLGPGLVMAQANTINLNGTGAAAPAPLLYAQETLPDAGTGGRRALTLAENMDIAVMPRRAIVGTDQEMYVRINLTGAQFAAAPALVAGAATGDLADLAGPLSSGGINMSFAILRIGATVNAGDLLGVRILGTGSGTSLNVTTATGNVTATIAAYTDPDDALDEDNPRSTFSGSGAIIRLVSGVSVTIDADDNRTASVDTGFARFDGPAASNGTASLGWLGVEEQFTAPTGGTGTAEQIAARIRAETVRNADDGALIERGDILELATPGDPTSAAVGMVSFNVMGNLDIGAFSIKPETFDPATMMPDGMTTCDGGAADTVDRGDLVGSDRMPLIGEEGELPSGVEVASTGPRAPDVYLLCLNVDVTGVASNMMAIPAGEYSAAAYIDGDGSTSTPMQMVGEEEDLASIIRDGASVEIPYLTTSEKHNQRLIVVNRGSRPAVITNIEVSTEDGTEYELTDTVQAAMDADLLMVPPNSTWTSPVRDVIEITGTSRRVSASLSFAARRTNISVATTQINLGDSSTDTVVYTVDGL